MGSVPILGQKMRFVVLGGNIVDQNALIRFYVLHCFMLPGAALIFMCFHFWRIRKDGGISGPPLCGIGQSEGELEEDGDVVASPRRPMVLWPWLKDRHRRFKNNQTIQSIPSLI